MFHSFRWVLLSLVAALSIPLVTGCKKAESPPEKTTGGLPPGETVLSVHWLGKDNLSAQTNSGYFLGIWDRPESTNLESHFLDQLAVAPLHILEPKPQAVGTNDAAAETNHPSFQLLRPLLGNLLKNEFFLEVSRATDGSSDFGIAMRLGPESAGLWQTNFARAFETFTNAPRSVRLHPVSSQYEGWTFAGLGNANNRAIQELRVRVTSPRPATPAGESTPWLEGEANLRRLLNPGLFPIGMPMIRFALAGQPQGVETRAIIDFPQPLPFKIEPWQIPTNLIHGPNYTFTAVQGLQPLISSLKWWKELQIGPAPNQLFFWAHAAHPALTYVAAPMKDASNALTIFSERLLTKGNTWLVANGTGKFEKSRDYEGIFCTAGNPLLGPFLKRDANVAPNVLLAGWGTSNATNSPPPDFLFKDVAGSTNLVFYDREITGSRIGAWFYLAQGLRVILWKAQVPFDSPSVRWLRKPGEMLGVSTTRITKTGPSQLTFDRSSSVGMNSVELHFLADYLESPDFPRGLHTTRTSGMKRPSKHNLGVRHSPTNRTNE